MISKKMIEKKRQEGFTIIEVLIVLAIAGLIILIVFLAVPALQRNSRNTQYKSQVSTYMGAVSEFMNNNNGRAPVAGDLTTINNLAADGPLTEPTALTTGAQTGDPALGVMQIQVGFTCSTTSVGDTVIGSSRSIALRYSVESSGSGLVKQCTGS
jgi:prepilin-type N-terminal cleavage/methylation domain-containing protein